MNATPRSFRTFLRRALWAAALLCGLLAATPTRAADADDKGTHFATVPVPAGFSAGDVQNAIVTTLLGRDWTVKSKTDGQVVGYLNRHGHEATVTLTYDASKADIFCIGYKVDKTTGAREKPEQPAGWLKNIQSDLAKNLNKLAALK